MNPNLRFSLFFLNEQINCQVDVIQDHHQPYFKKSQRNDQGTDLLTQKRPTLNTNNTNTDANGTVIICLS